MRTSREVLAPAGGPEALEAAVRAGADAVYLGASLFSARAGAHNFSKAELKDAVAYCHARNVRVHLAVNTLLFDSELGEALDLIAYACALPVDAVLVQDLGLLWLLRRLCPSLPLHASTQLSLHGAAGAKAAADAGFSRVVLAREMSLPEIAAVHNACPDLELEAFVHGALCMSVSGQCYFSAMLGGRSGNRGQCAQTCRLPFMAPGGTGHDLSLKDLSALLQTDALLKAGVCSFKIEGRLKRPEYVAAATHACRLALDGEKIPGALLEDLRAVFSRTGFTSGYLDGERGREMFGTRRKEDLAPAPVLHKLHALYKSERQSVPVSLHFSMRAGAPPVLSARDEDGRVVRCQSQTLPAPALRTPLTHQRCISQLQKAGGTPFFVKDCVCELDDGLAFPAGALNALRREALSALLEQRKARPAVPFLEEKKDALFKTLQTPHEGRHFALRARFPDTDVPDRAADCEWVEVPYDAPLSNLEALRNRGMRVLLELPRGLFGLEDRAAQTLRAAAQAGFSDVWAGTLEAAALARALGLSVHGGFSLNVTNSAALRWYTDFGLLDTELSVELTGKQMAALGGTLPRGLLVYGRQPMMLTRNCPIANAPDGCRHCRAEKKWYALKDRKGAKFPVRCFGACSEVYNSVPLSLLGGLRTFRNVDFGVLRFTDETFSQREAVLDAAFSDTPLSIPHTRGLFLRGVL